MKARRGRPAFYQLLGGRIEANMAEMALARISHEAGSGTPAYAGELDEAAPGEPSPKLARHVA